MIFFTSDLHIGHRLVAMLRFNAMHPEGHQFTREELQADRDSAAKVVEWHDLALAENWDRVVNKNDHVWVLGDISSGSGSGTMRALEWIGQRSGHKHLIAGNHDPVHPLNRDGWKWQSRLLGVFLSVQTAARRRIAGESVLLSHFPYQGQGEGTRELEERYPQWRLPDLGDWLLHGHVHSSEIWTAERSLHVGLDAWEMELVPLEKVEKLVRS